MVRLTRSELEAHPVWRAFTFEHPRRPPGGVLAVPLKGRSGAVLGLVRLSSKHDEDFTETDESILLQLGQIAAVAIENVRLYDKLRDQDRRKDEFLAMLAHELRNPLAPIRNAVQILRVARPTTHICAAPAT